MKKQADNYAPWMRRALALAKKGEGFTSPNPMVGAVLIKNGRVIGEGYHKAAGLPHAEINAINDALANGKNPKGATLIVTLEPCSHFGKTPPCADAIIEQKIKRVVIGVVDPNPCVCGGGIDKLLKAGVEIVPNVLGKQCRQLNEPFFHFMATGRPLVVVKVACSLDGKIATRTGHSQWISGPVALKYAHKLRARYDAICVGLGTVLADDPQLTYRGPKKAAHPLRVVLDSRCRVPLDAKIVSGKLPGKTLIATTDKASKKRIATLEKIDGVSVAVLPRLKGRTDLHALVEYLGKIEKNSLLIEGGAGVLASAIEQGVVDRIRMVIAPMIIGGKDAVPVIGGRGFATIDEALRLESISIGRLGEDILIRGVVRKTPPTVCEA